MQPAFESFLRGVQPDILSWELFFKLIKANIALDKNLPYKVLRKIMNTAATAGYQEFKFIVQGDYL